MNTETSILVSKIEKMWRKANHAGTTATEREAFEAKALSLMEENRITMAMLEIDNEDILGDFEYDFVTGRYARVVIDILDAVARAYDCKVYWRDQYGGAKHVFIFGFKSDAERSKLMAQMLISDAQVAATSERGIDAGHTFSLRHSFLQGYAAEIGRRLGEAARMANKAMDDQEGAKCAALVLVDRRTQVHESYAKRRVRTASATRVGNSTGYSRGAAAGRSASLSTQGRVKATKALAS